MLSAMRPSFRNPRRVFVFAILFGVCALALFGRARAATEIYHIERFLTNQVLLHIDTDGDRAYVLQYTDSLTMTSTGIVARWSNLFTMPAFPNHYVIVDTGTAPQRFYRLSVAP